MFQDGKKKTISSTSASSSTNSAAKRQQGLRQPQRLNRKRMRKCGVTNTGFLRFLFSNFRYSLTALSRGFASFPHGTCTLSVSHQYLAFDGIYHPLRAAIPNNSTLLHLLQRPGTRECHPLCCRVPTDLARPIMQVRPQFGLRRFTW